jgi:hypothetical protein
VATLPRPAQLLAHRCLETNQRFLRWPRAQRAHEGTQLVQAAP